MVNFQNEWQIWGADGLPFLADSYDESMRLWKVQKPLMEKKLAEQGLMILYAVPWPPQGVYSKKPLASAADLKGIKLRMPGTKEWLFLGQALGATATPLAFGEVYLGLKTGTIDAQDNPLPTVRAAKFHEVTRQLVLTGHLVDGLFLVVSNKVWKSLTPAQQQRMRQAAQAAARYNNDNRLKEESQLVDYFRQQGLQIQTPDVAAFRAAVQQAYMQSDYAKVWPSGLLDRINAVR